MAATAGTEFKASKFSAFFTGHYEPVKFLIYDEGVVVDLVDDFAEVRLQMFNDGADASLRHDFLLTRTSEGAATGEVLVTGAAGNVVCKLVGKRSDGSWVLFGKPWRAGIYLGGPHT